MTNPALEDGRSDFGYAVPTESDEDWLNTFTSDERVALRGVVRSVFQDHSTEANVRAAMMTEAGYDDGAWKTFAEIGLLGLAIPERLGGSGGSWADVCVVLEEAGRVLLCAPYLSTVVLGTGALLASHDDAIQAKCLPLVAKGELRLAVTTPWTLERSSLPTATRISGGGWRITGDINHVIDGHSADVLFALAADGGGVSMFAIYAGAAGLRREPLRTMDLTRKQARLVLDDVEASLVGWPGSGHHIFEAVQNMAGVGLAIESVGAAAHVLELAVAYATARYQFGRPIGSFQAVKHTLADVLVEVESARSVAYRAVNSLVSESSELRLDASAAKAYCPTAFFNAAAKCVQVHGGIGFTWEHPAHLYLKRAKSSELLLGDSQQYRAIVADELRI
jgi:alkylation response protein AidB-like acyl-CoA dehydrogenase